ncbi:calcium/proton exchanger [Saprolegnia diclina VS20]|uniref:Calcium/proton exchanger n=1 Tax=Saprolegnia diclina (strain VS20) TaxID=1156394 RepID=T0QBT0_SAPDV|nr:calcium/proton exchanger [Saprolegnia diclina VS20]EQC30970.1 calcium/proton exchanger [Saprolegnia diclina VS20]|eukprot:XP_008615708.1 calcium/proton exchanger [Saprolegnia diclina VS20]
MSNPHLKAAKKEASTAKLGAAHGEDMPLTGHGTRTVSQCEAIKDVILGSNVNALLLVAPFAAWSYFGHWSPMWVFGLNFLTMMPLANILGEATETLAEHTGDTIGGLVNASFGNAVEIIIAIFALKQGEIELVQSSLIGSMLSNLLLVLGCCFVSGHFGGAKESSFNGAGASINMSLLFVSSFAMLVPSYYQSTMTHDTQLEHEQAVLGLSHISAIFLVLMYAQLLFFQLYTHKAEVDEKEEEHKPALSMASSMIILCLATVAVAFFSEWLVSSVDEVTETSGIPKAFIGIILLPIVGNAVEHITALKVAYKNNMELAMGVAIGSATQISLFVVPVCVIAGWIMGQPMTLAFNTFEALTYIFSTLIVYVIVADGKSNWLEGSMLLTLYCLVGLSLLEITI